MPPTAPSLSPSPSNAELHGLAARVLVGAALIASALLLASALFNELLGRPTQFSRMRGAYGVVMLLAAWSALQWRASRPRLASTVVLGSAMLAAWAHAAFTGIGLHAMVLMGALFAVALSGVLCSVRTALAFASANAAFLVALHLAESHGWLPGLRAAATIETGERLLTQLLFTALALLVALLLARLLQQSLGRALEHEQRLDELLHIGSDWTWEADPRGRMTWVSPSFEARTGRPLHEVLHIGEPGQGEMVDDEEWRRLREDLRARRPFRDRQVGYRAPDGRLISLVSSGDPVFGPDGQLIGWRGVARNVTPERAAEKAQARMRLLLDRLVHSSPDAICVARLRDGVILLANPRFLQVAGRTEEQVRGHSAIELGLWRDPALPMRLYDALKPDGQVRDLRTLVYAHDGQVRPMLLTAAAFEWDGEPVAVITTRDVAEIERARAEADAILDHASVGIALVRHGRFERVNPLFETLFGHAPGQLAGQPTQLLFAGDDALAAAAAHSHDAELRGRIVDVECEAWRHDGQRLLVHLRAAPVDAERPLEHGAIWVVEDITERRRAERELAEAKRQAEAASQAKSAFLATMSHEIRTPLNGVLGLADLIREPQLDDARRTEYLGHLVRAAESLSSLVSDVLDLSKIEAGHLQIEAIGFDLHAVVHSIFETFAMLGQERGLQMRCQVEPEVPQRVRGDPVRVRQILANYLSNALKFTARGRITLRVARADGGRVRVEVHDSGPGVSEAVRAMLFRPFVQGDSSTTRRFGGTGLGLSICRELAERMDGAVGVDSDGTSGSCFWAELALPEEARAGTGAAALADGERPLDGLRVLVAEDNAVNMLIVGAMLRRMGAQVLEAEDGQQALAVALDAEQAVHVVLMDLHMPVLDGLEATRRIRADARCTGLPVYALSAAALGQERQDAQEAGMDGFIAKPVQGPELLQILRPLHAALRAAAPASALRAAAPASALRAAAPASAPSPAGTAPSP